MAKKMKTPGQKRKSILRIVILLLALVLICLGAAIKGGMAVVSKQLIEKHETVIADVTDVQEKKITYRKKKRKKTKMVYSVSYQFQSEGKTYTKTLMISEPEYQALKDKKQMEVWYEPGNPERSSFEAHLRAKSSKRSFTANAISASIVVVPVCAVLYVILAFLFVREKGGVIPEGFVTDTSWLDVDDNFLIVLEDENLAIVKIDEKRVSRVQDLYQESASLESMVDEGKGVVTRVPLAKITSIESKHYSDSIYVKYEKDDDSDSESVEFLNPTVKEHALERIAPKLSSGLTKSVKELTRIQAAIPSLIGAIICGGAMAFFRDAIFVLILGGIGLLYALKTLLTRVIDPTVITTWEAPEKEGTEE